MNVTCVLVLKKERVLGSHIIGMSGGLLVLRKKRVLGSQIIGMSGGLSDNWYVSS